MKLLNFGFFLLFSQRIISSNIVIEIPLKIRNFIEKQTGLTEYYEKITIQNTMKTITVPYSFRDVPFVTNTRVHTHIQQAFQNKQGGMHIVVSPPGTGKTTYIYEQAKKHICNGGYVRIFGNEIQNINDFYCSFGFFEHRQDLFRLLPDRSVIVLDQLELISPEMGTLLLQLAYESSRTTKCNIVVSVSDIVSAKKALNLYGFDKIRQCGKSLDFAWQTNEIEEFVEKGFMAWSEKQKQELKKLSVIAKSPTFLHTIHTLYYKTGLPDDLVTLQHSARMFEKEWERFQEYGV